MVGNMLACLASALAYMHSQNMHHEDIKPANIIHRRNKVYFTDFSSSRKLHHCETTLTSSEVAAAPLYAAPEAFYNGGKACQHGSQAEVCSLGLVFAEILTKACRGSASVNRWADVELSALCSDRCGATTNDSAHRS
jgi:serine/threonine protein kinase